MPEEIRRSTTCFTLLVYDMQAGILSQIKNSEQIGPLVLEVLGMTRQCKNKHIVFSTILILPKELMGMSDSGQWLWPGNRQSLAEQNTIHV